MPLLEYGLSDQTGFVIVVGDVGSGKTTLIRRLLKTASRDLVVALVSNTHPDLGDLLGAIVKAFDLDLGAEGPIARYHALIEFVIDQYAHGKRCVLIIDEADRLSASALEEVRMLSNVNADKDFVLQLILVGQNELKATLRRPDMRQFAQRVSVFHKLTPLSAQETEGYIRHRLACAGGPPDLFDTGACAAAHHYTFGIPRLINILCDLALLIGFGENRAGIDVDVILDAVTVRAASGLGVFREDPEGVTREDRRRAILKEIGREESGAKSAPPETAAEGAR